MNSSRSSSIVFTGTVALCIAVRRRELLLSPIVEVDEEVLLLEVEPFDIVNLD